MYNHTQKTKGEFMESKDRKLAVAIARCENLSIAVRDESHPCHKVASFQVDAPSRHIPEAWFGNITDAQVLLISSNPSIDLNENVEGENYPRANWGDDQISEWITRRVDQSWSEVPVTFQRSPFKNFLWRCIDGKYRGAGKGNQPQPTWNNTHKLVIELLGPSADPSKNYALTEVVHCKSQNGIGVPEASPICSANWLGKIMDLATDARVVVLLGSHVRPWARNEYKNSVPKDFGKRVTAGGMDVAIRDSFVQSGRVYIYLPHPTAAEPGGRLPSTRFGAGVHRILAEIAKGEKAVPATTSELHRRFREGD